MLNLVCDPTSDNPYLRAGFKDQKAYFKSLSDAWGISYKKIKAASYMLDENGAEDFDALLLWLDDYTDSALIAG